MDLASKNKYIADHLMKLTPDTLRFMVADLVAAVDSARRYNGVLHEASEKTVLTLQGKLKYARHEGRMEALDSVFQINGPSRAITQLKEKYAAELPTAMPIRGANIQKTGHHDTGA